MGNSSHTLAEHRSLVSPADDPRALQEWKQQQDGAIKLRDRLQLFLTRHQEAQEKHAFLRPLLEQLQQLAAMAPGTVPLAHYTVRPQSTSSSILALLRPLSRSSSCRFLGFSFLQKLLTNASSSLGTNTPFVSGATPAEIERLPTRTIQQNEVAEARRSPAEMRPVPSITQRDSNVTVAAMAHVSSLVFLTVARSVSNPSSQATFCELLCAFTRFIRHASVRTAATQRSERCCFRCLLNRVCLCLRCVDPWLATHGSCPQCRVKI